MLHKFALAFKTKTIEFFAEEDDDEEDRLAADLDSAEEVITGQRVVVVKPDNPINGNGGKKPSPAIAVPRAPVPSQHKHQLNHGLLPSLFATVSSFHAAYLNLQVAHEPFHPDGITAADRSAVSHLQRLSDLRRAYRHLHRDPGDPAHGLLLSSYPEAQVQENQSTLRKFETVFNRLQSDIDKKDAEVSALKDQLREMEASNLLQERKLGSSCISAHTEDGDGKLLMSIGVFDTILKEAYGAAHSFTKILIDLLKKSGWNLEAAARSIYPDTGFVKSGHHGYALLSYISLGMFGGFGSDDFGSEGDGEIASSIDGLTLARRKEFLRQFVEHSSIDPMKLLAVDPGSEFATFCESKYRLLIHPGIESSLFGEPGARDTMLGSLQPSSPLYEPFVSMGSLVWKLHKLAMAFDRAVEIFQVQKGVDFSMVYMENVICRKTSSGSWIERMRPKVGFTVFPGFRLGASVVQCKVYLDHTNCSS
uniref:GTPase obg n=1 Tax=Anthurium amnicola TaxID=1678845 RepID=A0A1D1Z269_9ARAE